MAYQDMALLYDKLMAGAPYDQWIEFTHKVFEQSGKEFNAIADLGCGTGEITVKLAKAGYKMTGIDYSSEMLTYAEHKASEAKVTVQWLQQDLRDLDGLTELDAAVSYCDVINYITDEEEISSVFNRVAASLREGGLFIFDIHSLYHVEHHFINQTFADVMEDTSYIWFCMEGEQPGEMFHDLTFFSLDGDKYERFEEYHHQRTYSIKFYQRLLKDAGFNNLQVYGDFSLERNSLNEKTERIFFIAEKRSR
ncbi:class I SAM-dependent methyltransferase [Virgibacillus sp. C22-A2]|uniref:Class I SAM-dependent methyltransferase n=1 Tax=Virgibacillus tibetensis TaxID=3042313 RepID=A0ABU6KAL0_9BACI|nr:class I SAM-dependent methyltransferase [Virgibacillus sp. C22-A2]